MATYTPVPKNEGYILEAEVNPASLIDDGSRQQQGARWKLTLQAGAATIALVLMINIVVTAWSVSRFGVSGGLSTLYQGNCTKAKNLSFWTHILINVLGTLMLGASNNAQQFLSAPTRSECDNAHSKKDWLDVGIPSFKNLLKGRIEKKRQILWWLLAFSSVPLHWMYNSAAFETVSAKQYSVLVVSNEFITGPRYTPFYDPAAHVSNDMDVRATNDSILTLRSIMGTFERLTPAECVQAYGTQVVTGRRDLIVVVDGPSYDVKFFPNPHSSLGGYFNNPNITNSVLEVTSSEYGNWIYATTSYDWMCDSGQDCGDPSAVASLETNWEMPKYGKGHSVQYCLSEKVDETCSFSVNVVIMIIVIVFNLTKLLCLILALWVVEAPPLATIGDAIMSFMADHDPNTAGMSTLSKADFSDPQKWVAGPKPYQAKPRRYFSAASGQRWIYCNLLYAAGLGTIAGLLGRAINSITTLSTSASTNHLIVSLGFGKLVAQNLLLSPTSLFASVLLANLPQVILAGIYLTYNALITSMCLTREYTSYSVLCRGGKAKSLRVSYPIKGSLQKRAYYLQLPFRFSIPLLAASAFLHWFVSQSLFLAKVDIYHSNNVHLPSETQIIDKEASIATCGFSVLPMICGLVLAGIMVLVLNIVAFRKVEGGMPGTGSCSAAIAAACHGVGNGEGNVSWGAAGPGESERLRFSGGPSDVPVLGALYS